MWSNYGIYSNKYKNKYTLTSNQLEKAEAAKAA